MFEKEIVEYSGYYFDIKNSNRLILEFNNFYGPLINVLNHLSDDEKRDLIKSHSEQGNLIPYYHEEWRALMPIIEKIALLNDGAKIRMEYGTGATDSFSSMEISYWIGQKEYIIKTPLSSNEDGSEDFIYNCWKTVVSFILWYNKYVKIKG